MFDWNLAQFDAGINKHAVKRSNKGLTKVSPFCFGVWYSNSGRKDNGQQPILRSLPAVKHPRHNSCIGVGLQIEGRHE